METGFGSFRRTVRPPKTPCKDDEAQGGPGGSAQPGARVLPENHSAVTIVSSPTVSRRQPVAVFKQDAADQAGHEAAVGEGPVGHRQTGMGAGHQAAQPDQGAGWRRRRRGRSGTAPRSRGTARSCLFGPVVRLGRGQAVQVSHEGVEFVLGRGSPSRRASPPRAAGGPGRPVPAGGPRGCVPSTRERRIRHGRASNRAPRCPPRCCWGNPPPPVAVAGHAADAVVDHLAALARVGLDGGVSKGAWRGRARRLGFAR
jgi:hypothetical protein